MPATALPLSPRLARPAAPQGAPPARTVMGVRVHATTYTEAARLIVGWARRGESRTVCATGAHGIVEAQTDAELRAALNAADLDVPDGTPLVWTLRALGLPAAERVYGPDLTLHVLRAAAWAGVPVALYGSTPETLALLRERLTQRILGLRIVCTISPPFRPLTAEEDAAFVEEIKNSGARIVLVGLGCPRQEKWVEAHRGKLPAVLVAVGAAFDFHAGRLRQAPAWMQRAGLEWAFRLAVEPRRLWRRYTRIVPRFAAGALADVRRARRTAPTA